MPADREKSGMGTRRQSRETDPDRADDSRKARERSIDRNADEAAEHDPGWQPGADSPAGPHRVTKPGTQSDLEDAGLAENPER